jgi:hypothetical protein
VIQQQQNYLRTEGDDRNPNPLIDIPVLRMQIAFNKQRRKEEESMCIMDESDSNAIDRSFEFLKEDFGVRLNKECNEQSSELDFSDRFSI